MSKLGGATAGLDPTDAAVVFAGAAAAVWPGEAGTAGDTATPGFAPLAVTALRSGITRTVSKLGDAIPGPEPGDEGVGVEDATTELDPARAAAAFGMAAVVEGEEGTGAVTTLGEVAVFGAGAGGGDKLACATFAGAGTTTALRAVDSPTVAPIPIAMKAKTASTSVRRRDVAFVEGISTGT